MRGTLFLCKRGAYFMSLRPRVPGRSGRYVFLAFLLLTALATLLSPAGPNAASAGSIRFSASVGAATADLVSKLQNPLDPITWSANVRANTDSSGYGQHEPALAVSPTNPN